jgi:4-carboxymuconolactone decarboxylase
MPADADVPSQRESLLAAFFEEGLTTRRAVLGTEYVDGSLSSADDFMMTMQHITTEWCWGYAWNRPGLQLRTRSMLNLAMLTALGRSSELKLHVRGALNNGVTVAEIREILVQATIYCGVPAGLDAFKAAHEVLVAAEAIGGAVGQDAESGGPASQGTPGR